MGGRKARKKREKKKRKKGRERKQAFDLYKHFLGECILFHPLT